MINEIAESRKNKTPIKSLDLEAFQQISKKQAYICQKNLITQLDGSSNIAAWKLGGANQKTRDVFRVSELYWGPLFRSNLKFLIGDEIVDISLSDIVCGEVECAVKLANSFDLNNLPQISDIYNVISDVSLSVEFPWSVFDNIPSLGVSALISDLCASGVGLIGNPVDIKSFCENEEMNVSYKINNTLSETGNLDVLIDGLKKTIHDFIQLSKDEGFQPKPGDWIFTGGLTSCARFAVGDIVSIKAEGFDTIKFRVID